MILFLDDWKKYPDAIPHTRTSNTSWLRLAEVYKRMGVKNYYFHLALFTPELADVDPYDKNLDEETKYKISIECRFNPWYYFREVARIKPQASSDPIPFEANRGNIALYWLYFNHINVALIQIRQTGKSVSTDKLMEWLIDFGCTNTTIALLTKDDSLRVTNVNRIKESRKLLPGYLQRRSKRDSDNSYEITNLTLNNRLSTYVGQANEFSANNQGRGMTVPTVWSDESPFTAGIHTIIPAMLGATTAVRAEAARAGTPYGNIFTTTAGDKDNKPGRFMYELIHGGLPWSEHLFDCTDQRMLSEVVDKGSKGQMAIVNCTFNHKQLGKTDEWLREVLRSVPGSPDQLAKDFFNEWGAGGASSPIDKEILKVVNESAVDPAHLQITKDLYTLRWYIPEYEIEEYMATHKTVLGLDTSEAIGKDAISMVLLDEKTLETIAAGSFTETNLIRFANYIADFMIHYKNVTLIPERRSTGQAFIDTLLIRLPLAKIDPFTRIFNTVVHNADNDKDLFRSIQNCLRWSPSQFDSYKKYFGFATSGSGQFSRTGLYSDVLQSAVRQAGNVVKDKPLIEEISSLETKNGRIDHRHDGHDDMVIAWLLANWLLMFGKNLRHYGITDPMSRTLGVKAGARITEEDRERKVQMDKIREEIESLIDELARCRDDNLAWKLEHRIRLLDTKYEHDDDVTTLDSLIKSAKERRKKQARERQWRN